MNGTHSYNTLLLLFHICTVDDFQPSKYLFNVQTYVRKYVGLHVFERTLQNDLKNKPVWIVRAGGSQTRNPTITQVLGEYRYFK